MWKPQKRSSSELKVIWKCFHGINRKWTPWQTMQCVAFIGSNISKRRCLTIDHVNIGHVGCGTIDFMLNSVHFTECLISCFLLKWNEIHLCDKTLSLTCSTCPSNIQRVRSLRHIMTVQPRAWISSCVVKTKNNPQINPLKLQKLWITGPFRTVGGPSVFERISIENSGMLISLAALA